MKINFEYSSVYDMMLSEMTGNFDESSIKKSHDFLSSTKLFWNSNGDRIVNEIENVSKLKFKKNVDCFVVSSMPYESISHPFTIKAVKSSDKLFAMFVHELIHILMSQNFRSVHHLLSFMDKDHNYRVHFPVLLIERRVLERLNRDYKKQKRIEDLDYVWEDVNKVYPKFCSSRGIVKFLKENAVNRQV